ncbi:MAG: TMEM43 family protein [Alphaproteobacteria bacterium]
MTDEFKEVTTTSWGKRIVNSFMGIIFGIIFFIGAFHLIFWNEGRSVDRIITLDEGRSLVVAVASEQVNPSYNSALIHISGNAVTNSVLKDPFFGVQENALKLKRTVEMYQWKESKDSKTEKNLGGSETTEATYSYDKTWSEEPINSGEFKKREGHENPAMPYKSETYSATNITIGAFKLSNPFIKQINKFEPYPLSQKNFSAMDSRFKQSFALNGNTYFYGDSANPQIGAIRISYGIIKPTDISVVGKQDSNTIQTYYTKNGEISLLEMGNIGAESMFASAESENTLITCLVRLGAFVLMWVGLAMILGPISVLGDVVPFIGSLLGAGIGLVTGVVSLVLSFTTIAIAWIVYRPVIGIVLLILAGGFFFGGFKMIKGKLQQSKAS